FTDTSIQRVTPRCPSGQFLVSDNRIWTEAGLPCVGALACGGSSDEPTDVLAVRAVGASLPTQGAPAYWFRHPSVSSSLWHGVRMRSTLINAACVRMMSATIPCMKGVHAHGEGIFRGGMFLGRRGGLPGGSGRYGDGG